MKKIVHKPAAPLYAAAAVWVLYALLGAGQRVEQGRLTAVGVARKGNFDLLFHVSRSFMVRVL